MLSPPPGNPPMPGDVAFDPGGLSGSDPVATGINNVAALITAQNPEMDETTVRRVARKVVGRLTTQGDFDPFSMMPNIEDPLANRSPFSTKNKNRNQPEQGRSDSSLPDPPETSESLEPEDDPEEPEQQAEHQVERAAGGAAGRAMLSRLPMLLV